MQYSWTWSALIGGVALLAACQDETSGPIVPDGSSSSRAPFAQSAQGDHALQMRAALRARSAEEVVDAVQRGRLVVTIGFKPEGAPWGVDERGRSLVTAAVKAHHMRSVEGMAKRVLHRFETIPAITVELPNAQLAVQLRGLPWVDYVAEATQLLTPDAANVECIDVYGNPPPRGTASSPQTITWNITRVRADQAWSIATGISPTNDELSVLDDGADEQQANLPLGPELGGAVVYAWYVGKTSYDGTHGTPVLGAASARNNSVGVVGVAPGTTTRVLKIYDPSDTRWDYWTAFAIDGNAAYSDVMSISYSTKQTSSSAPASFTAMYDAIKNAYYQQGVVFTASTGNQHRSDLYAYPARYPEVVGVGGSGYSDEWVYNNYAPGNVEISAPAVDVGTVCKGGQTGVADGTSFATPMVAGGFMLLRQRFPSESPGQLRTRMQNTAVPMASSQKSGAGRMDVYAALTR